jgi:hypothetical protein
MTYEIISVIVDEVELEHVIVTNDDGSVKSFPVDEANPEYAAFLESLNDNTNEAE